MIPDRKVEISLPAQPASNTTHKAATAPQVGENGPYAVCPTDPAKPLIEPEALQSINALRTDGKP